VPVILATKRSIKKKKKDCGPGGPGQKITRAKRAESVAQPSKCKASSSTLYCQKKKKKCCFKIISLNGNVGVKNAYQRI
jgi:hypothetical protein